MISGSVIPVLLSVLVTAFMFRRGPRSSPVAYFAAYATFFLMAPIVNHALGDPLFQGTVVSAIPEVAWWYVLAIGGLALADLPLAKRTEFRDTETLSVRAHVPLLLSLLGAYGVLYGLTLGIVAPTKRAALESVGDFHHRYLILEAVIVSAFWFFREKPQVRKFYYLNAGAYVFYCLAFRERDFLFVVFAVAVTGILYGHLRARWGLLLGLVTAIAATGLFVHRAGREFSTSSVLNQGSNLFVDTFLASAPSYVVRPLSDSYQRLLLGEPATEVGGTSVWLKSLYSPDGQSGYGFSLVGEARFNVGLVGIVVVFILVACLLRAAFLGGHFWDPRITGPALMFTLLYALRGDMRAVLVGLFYVTLGHFVLVRLPRRSRPGPAGRPAAGTDHEVPPGRTNPSDAVDRPAPRQG